MIIANNINKIFKQGTKPVHAARDVSIEISRGERIYIHGPSGAGKSTLLHILGGLSSPTAGLVTFNGNNMYKQSDRKRSRLRNKHFGFIFQLYHLLPELSILENVMLPALIKGKRSRRDIISRSINILKSVGMESRLKHGPNSVSGGEAQRTAVARALVNSPDILFCDEPTGNLDSKMTAEIYALIRNMSETSGMSVVVVSHQDMEKDFFHSEYVMKDGVLERIKQDRRQNKTEDPDPETKDKTRPKTEDRRPGKAGKGQGKGILSFEEYCV